MSKMRYNCVTKKLPKILFDFRKPKMFPDKILAINTTFLISSATEIKDLRKMI